MSAPFHAMRCPRCNDDLKLYHTAGQGRPRHFLGCQNYPQCSYTADYDAALHQLLQAMDKRLIRAEAHIAQLTEQIEASTGVVSPTERQRALTTWADVAHRFQGEGNA